jgi:hypothetical protein
MRHEPATHRHHRFVLVCAESRRRCKRFSFLAREFARLGYGRPRDHPESREWTQWKSDVSLPLSGQVQPLRGDTETAARGQEPAASAINGVLGRLVAPVGWQYFWANPATRKALEVARKLRRGRDCHLAGAGGTASR